MPLLLTPAQPFQNDALLEVPVVYAIILTVGYDTRQKLISYGVGYYASETAYLAPAAPLRIDALPVAFTQPATPEQANAVPIFQFLEQVLATQLRELLGPDTTIENVA